MEKQEFTIKINADDSLLLQKKQYEFNAKASIIAFLAQDKAIDWESLQEEITAAEVASVELDLAKSLIAYRAAKNSDYDINLQYYGWKLDYYTYELTFTQEMKIPNFISSVSVTLEDKDLENIEKKQYEYNAAATIMTFLKESSATNPEIIKEYNKVLVQRKIDLDSLKSDIANKYNLNNLDLRKHDWNIDFNEKTITFNEVN